MDRFSQHAFEFSPKKRALLDRLLQKEGMGTSSLQKVPRRQGIEAPPLSFAQQRIWFLDQFETGNPFYNIPVALRLQGTLNVAVLERSFNEIIRRHESLRTVFGELQEQPVQRIMSALELPLTVIEMAELPVNIQEKEARRIAAQETQHPFALAQGPLVRTSLLHLSESEHVLLLSMHHSISDGWSMGIFLQETTILYQAFCAGKPSLLSELPVQYADYALWQRQWLQDEVLENQLFYWQQQLRGAPLILKLPTDRPRPAVLTSHGARHTFDVSAALVENLKILSRQEDATLFMTLLAAWQALLYRYSGQDDLLVGTPIANRTLPQIEGLIGCFVNTLVLRADLSGDPSFRTLLGRVREVCLGAYAHQDLPFEQLVEALQPQRDLSHTPLFQVLFVLQNAPLEAFELPGLRLHPLDVERTTAKFDLTLTLQETAQGLQAVLEYNSDLFEAPTITRMAGHWKTLLEGIVARPEQPVSSLPLLTEAERRQMLVEWNATDRTYPKSFYLHELFEIQVMHRPDRVAVVYEDEQISYRELNRRANQLAHFLQKRGVGAEGLVGVYMERSLDMLVALLGILKAGGAYVPLDPAYPAERLLFMLEETMMPVVLTQQRLLGGLPGRGTEMVLLDAGWEAIAEELVENPIGKAAAEDLAYVIYTSGSTGRPKGVQVAHRAVVNFLHAMSRQPGLTDQDRLLALTSLSFDIAALELFLPITVGACVVLVGREVAVDGALLSRQLADTGATVMQATPAIWQLLVDAGGPDIGCLKILCGGEAFPRELASQLLERGRSVWNLYGPTETTIWSSIHQITTSSEPISLGRPLANTRIYVLDAYLQPVPIGIPGELHIGGEGVARGYLHRPELTAERFVPDPFSTVHGARLYRTGDLARFRPDGTIEFMGRFDHQVKLRGYRIELGEIESVLREHPAVRQAVVVVREDKPGDRRLVAYIVPHQQTSMVSDVRDYVQTRLPDYMRPSAFVLLETLPLTPNEKLDRRALPAPGPARPELGELYAAPRTPVEEVLAGIWSQVLELERVGIHDNFFGLGGHSLLATRLISRVRETFQVEVPLRALFEAPSVAGLAERVVMEYQAEHGLRVPPLHPFPRDGDLPLSFAQQRLWFLEQFETNSSLYNISAALRLRGTLNVSALAQSFNEIVKRHEALRTTFATVEGRPVQRISSMLHIRVPVADVAALPESLQEVQVQQLAIEEATLPFDLAHGPLVRAHLLRVGQEEHVFLLTIHHIVSDGWSLGVLLRELTILYASISAGENSPLPALPIQYADFTLWQRQWLRDEVLKSQLSYWQQQLHEAPLILKLPADRPRPAVLTYRGARYAFTLSKSLLEDLNILSRREGVTLFMILLAAWQTLLFRYSGQEDLLVGTPIANRTHPKIEELIGFFVNTLVLRGDLSGDPSFRVLLGRVREVTLQAYTHQDLPFEHLVEALQPQRDLSYTPLFQVLFVLQNAPMEAFELPELDLLPLDVEQRTAKFDLTLTLQETTRGLRAVLEYNTDLFEAATASRMLHHFQMLLDGIVADPEQRLSDLPILTPTEQQQLLLAWNATADASLQEHFLPQALEAQAHLVPDVVAVVFDDEQLSYRHLHQRANQLAHFLRSQGVGPEILVGICMHRSLDLVVALLAILKAGAAYVPLDPTYPADRLAFMLQDAQVSVLLTHPDLNVSFPHGPRIYLPTDWPHIAQQRTEPPTSLAWPGHLAYVIYTSGSTGQPKGVMNTHRGLGNRLGWMQHTYQLDGTDRVLQKTPISFDVSVWEFFWPLSSGACLVLARPDGHRDSGYLVDLIDQQQITILHFVPSMLRILLQEPGLPACHSLRRVFCSGEALPYDLQEQFLATVPVALHNLYGPTEAAIEVTSWACGGYTKPQVVPIGRPIANIQIYLLDRSGHPVPVGVPGELHIGGVGLARGYLRRPELTAEKFVPNPFSALPGERLYRTGDRACYLSDGTIEFLGRLDEQIKLRGLRIEPGEIEAVLAEHPGVWESVVVAREETAGTQQLVAYVLPTAFSSPGAEQAWLAETSLPSEHVSHWQQVFDEAYREPLAPAEVTFNTASWKSSYTGLPLPEAAMREWVEQTVERIRQCEASRVLEIGCGMGLLLFPLAPACDSYMGTDVSDAALHYLHACLGQPGQELPQVRVEKRAADDLMGLPPASFDLVILNSVVQYFPSVSYLLRVLDQALRLLSPDGCIFIGDVRSLPLLEVFHTSVELHRAAETLSSDQLARRVYKRVSQEQELVIDPAFFEALPQRFAQVSQVDIQLKRGRQQTELTRFRYDVVLRTGAPSEPVGEPVWLDWQEQGLSVSAVRQMLRESEPERVYLRKIPNARLLRDVRVRQMLSAARRPETVGALRQMLQERPLTEGVDPEDLWAVGDELSYTMDLRWSEGSQEGSYDAVVRRGKGRGKPAWAEEAGMPGVGREAGSSRAWHSYATNPLRERLSQNLVPQLRGYLKQSLPEYMIPSIFVVLDSWPLAPNGKLDRQALPAPERSSSDRTVAFVAARTRAEELLATIWATVLNLEHVGIQDNFFELGGDSILSIQIVSQARQVGLHFTPKQMFQHQTIVELAGAIDQPSSIQTGQAPMSGPVLLTPIQHWFFEQQFPDPHHFNQALLLEVRSKLDAALLEQILHHVLLQHDALRLRFAREEGVWKQISTGPEATFPLIRVDLTRCSLMEQRVALEAIASQVQASLHLTEGPLFRVVLFDLGSQQPARLLLVSHHLIIDGVSWRILLADLHTAYQQVERGEAIHLPPRTTAFQQWAAYLNEFAHATSFQQELAFWLAEDRTRISPLPRDYPAGSNTRASARRLSLALSAEETRALLQEAPAAYHTHINDLLLTALVQAVSTWTGTDRLLFDLEGHGREEIREGVDLSRTVGWFTTLFPVLLDLTGARNTGEAIKSIKEQLRGIPRRGIGYGILRYMNGEAGVAERLRALPQAEISFNYLGQFEQAVTETSLFKLARESSGPTSSNRGKRNYLLEVSGLVVQGQLHITWTYSEQIHKQTSIEQLAQGFLLALRVLVAYCQSGETGGYTPSDFPLSRFNQDMLDRFIVRIGQPGPVSAQMMHLEDIYELSPMQQGILFHTLYSPGSGVYVQQLSCTLRGNLDISVFQQAWQQVTDQHQALRTAFHWDGLESPLQVVFKQMDLPWQQQDWRGMTLDQQQDHFMAFLRADRLQGFDLTRAPLMRLQLIQIAEGSHLFVWSYHHMLLDGWSLPLVFKDVFACYSANCGGEIWHMEPRRPYREYIAWLGQQDLTQAEAFWRQTLRGFQAPTPLTGDKIARELLKQEQENEVQQIRLSEAATSALRSLARQHKLTLNTLLQGAWALLLSHYSGQEDVVFGMTVSGRPPGLSGVGNMIGLFINTLPVRVQVPPMAPLIGWLQQLQAQQAELRQYEFSPLVQVQKWSEGPADEPLFESIMVFENYPVSIPLRDRNGELELEQIRSFGQTNYTLSLEAVPGTEVALQIGYDTRRFEASNIKRMLGHLQTLLEGMVAHPQQHLAHLPLLTKQEHQQLLVEWNATRREYPHEACLHQLFERQAAQTPEAVALVFESEQLSYQELNRQANQLAHHLQSLCVGPDVLVGVCMERSLELVVGILGILKAGGAYIPLDPTYPAERLSFLLTDAQVGLLLTQERLRERLPGTGAQVLCLESDGHAPAGWGTTNPFSGVTSRNLAYVIYTSGSTGKPKGVLIPHQGACNLAEAQICAFGAQPGDRILQFASLSFDASVWEIMMALRVGATLCLTTQETLLPGPTFVRWLREQAITIVTLPPSVLSILPAVELPALHTIITAGEACSTELVTDWATDHRFFNAYGPTETTVCATVFECSNADSDRKPAIGRPIANAQVYVLDAHFQPVPIGVCGELYVAGNGLARGYLNRPDLTADRFIPNSFSHQPGARLYRTGDLARYRSDGNIEFVGRRDSQVKIRGYRIELGEIEETLNQHFTIQQCAVMAREDMPGQQRLVAYIVPRQGQTCAINDMRSTLQAKLPQYMIPSAFVLLEALPLTSSGKVDRRALPMPEDFRPELEVAYIAPQSELERTIATIWQEILQLEKVGIHDNFFDLGGHSLLLMRVQSSLRTVFNKEISLADLFKYPTVGSLAKCVKQGQSEELSFQSIYDRVETRRTAAQRRKQRRQHQTGKEQRSGQDE